MKKFLALILSMCLAVLTTACGSDNPSGSNELPPTTTSNSPSPNKTVSMGRYVENELVAMDDSYYLNGSTDSNGDFVFYTIERNDKEQGAIVKRNLLTKDGNVSGEVVSWLNRLITEGSNIHSISENKAGETYVVYLDAEMTFRLLRHSNGEIQYIDMPNWMSLNMPSESGGVFSFEAGDEKKYSPSGVIALENGFLALYDMDGVFEYDRDANLVRQYAELGFKNCVSLYENRLGLFDYESGTITVYDVNTATTLETVSVNTKKNNYMSLVSEFVLNLNADGIFMASGDGLFKFTDGDWKMIVDGGLTLLSKQNVNIAGLFINNDVFYGFLGGASLKVVCYAFDETVPTEPAVILDIFSLRDNNTIRQTIGEFQSANPDVRVNLRIGLPEESSASEEDVIRSLNTEILAGKGPDLIILDGLPVDSYIEKGVLSDLSGLVDDLEKQGMFGTFKNTFGRGDAVYGLATRFSVPVMVGDKNSISTITSLSDLVNAVSKANDDGVSLLRIPDSLIQENGMMMDYYDSCADSFMNQDGSINQSALSDYLGDMLKLNNLIKENAPENYEGAGVIAVSGGGRGMETFDMASWDLRDGKALMNATTLGGVFALRLYSSSLQANNDMGLVGLFNQKKYFPLGAIGVVASGSQKEIAEQFVSLALSRTVQDAYLYDGFPVNKLSLEAVIKEYMEENTTDMGFINICEQLETAVVVDAVIREAVKTQIPALLAEEITPDEAAKKIVDETRLYLNE